MSSSFRVCIQIALSQADHSCVLCLKTLEDVTAHVRQDRACTERTQPDNLQFNRWRDKTVLLLICFGTGIFYACETKWHCVRFRPVYSDWGVSVDFYSVWILYGFFNSVWASNPILIVIWGSISTQLFCTQEQDVWTYPSIQHNLLPLTVNISWVMALF